MGSERSSSYDDEGRFTALHDRLVHPASITCVLQVPYSLNGSEPFTHKISLLPRLKTYRYSCSFLPRPSSCSRAALCLGPVEPQMLLFSMVHLLFHINVVGHRIRVRPVPLQLLVQSGKDFHWLCTCPLRSSSGTRVPPPTLARSAK